MPFSFIQIILLASLLKYTIKAFFSLLSFCYQTGSLRARNPVFMRVLGLADLFPLDKFKYMEVYLLCFSRKNFRKYVNISPLIFGCSFS